MLSFLCHPLNERWCFNLILSSTNKNLSNVYWPWFLLLWIAKLWKSLPEDHQTLFSLLEHRTGLHFPDSFALGMIMWLSSDQWNMSGSNGILFPSPVSTNPPKCHSNMENFEALERGSYETCKWAHKWHLLYRKTYFSLHRTDTDIHIMLNGGDSGVREHLPLPILIFCWYHLSTSLFFCFVFTFLRCLFFLNISASPVYVLIFYLQCLKFIFSSIYPLSFDFIISSSFNLRNFSLTWDLQIFSLNVYSYFIMNYFHQARACVYMFCIVGIKYCIFPDRWLVMPEPFSK